MGPFVRHVSWVLTLVNALPESISSRCMPGWGGFLRMKNDILDHMHSIEAQQSRDPNVNSSLSDLLSAKSKAIKVAQQQQRDGQMLVEGGTLTTSWAMSLATFHLLNRPDTLRKLRDELFEAMPNSSEPLTLDQLEALPYLGGVVKEALRLSMGTSSRLARVAPDETLVYRDPSAGGREWRLPAGSVVGMSPYKTVMDEAIFPDARGFHPERWIEGSSGGAARLEGYLGVFCSGGHGGCLGMALARAELAMVLAKLFRQWGSGGVLFGDDEGDVRDGDVGCLSIYETRVRDCEMTADYFIPIPYKVSLLASPIIHHD